jgi:nicotinate-nucleotide adenylyltransferase
MSPKPGPSPSAMSSRGSTGSASIVAPRPRVGLIGGTFDPIHLGHLAAALAAGRALALDLVRFIPSARPPHRPDSPRASEYHRLEMTRLAVADAAVEALPIPWEVSDQELRRDGPSFTIDTLAAQQREGLSPLQLFFVIGADAFAEIASWHRYPAVLDAAHFAVVARPGTTLDELRGRLPALRDRMASPSAAMSAQTPHIFLIEADTPNVSSTDIRRRVARGESLDGLVTPVVAAYIAQHSLYAH